MFRLLAIFQSFSNTDQLFEFLTVRVFIGKISLNGEAFLYVCVCDVCGILHANVEGIVDSEAWIIQLFKIAP